MFDIFYYEVNDWDNIDSFCKKLNLHTKIIGEWKVSFKTLAQKEKLNNLNEVYFNLRNEVKNFIENEKEELEDNYMKAYEIFFEKIKKYCLGNENDLDTFLRDNLLDIFYYQVNDWNSVNILCKKLNLDEKMIEDWEISFKTLKNREIKNQKLKEQEDIKKQEKERQEALERDREEKLSTFLNSNQWLDRLKLTKFEKLPKEVAIKLSKDESEFVREELVERNDLPLEALEILANDEIIEIKSIAKRKLTIRK